MIGVIYGGNSLEHDVAISSAKDIIDSCDALDIYLTKDHTWIVNGKKVDNIIPILRKCSIVFPITHGGCGEDGTLQGFLEMNGIPYVGSGVTSSAICMDKDLTKRILNSHGIKTAPFQTFFSINEALNANISLPCVVKASSLGSSFGVYFVKDNLPNALKQAFSLSKKVLIEDLIIGREIWCSVIEKGNELIISDPCEIIKENPFFSHNDKYHKNSTVKYMMPGKNLNIPHIKEIVRKTYNILECRHLARVDLFIDEKNEVIVNEVNTLPGFTKKSLFPNSLINNTLSYKNLVDYLTT